jgi:MoaA/NifB/PqqE/SkfB family radical SAM enzyme
MGAGWVGDSMAFGVDIEPTNRCNAKCSFCPRDQTPHQGLMSRDVFEQALLRTVQLRDRLRSLGRDDPRVNLCGLGEPLLNRHTPDFIRRIGEEGFPCNMSSNAALLDERRSHAVLDAGLKSICINVGDRDDDYEDIYQLPFERTRDNILRFRDLAQGLCTVIIVLVNHRQDRAHVEDMRAYWSNEGLSAFIEYEIMNRGGALFVDHMQFETFPQREEARRLLVERDIEASCVVPFVDLTIGYDGQHYLCCSDWKKEVPLGSVFDASFVDVITDKLNHVRTRGTVCKTCNMDPLNRLTEALRARDDGEIGSADVENLLGRLDKSRRRVFAEMEELRGEPLPLLTTSHVATARRTIPVTAT